MMHLPDPHYPRSCPRKSADVCAIVRVPSRVSLGFELSTTLALRVVFLARSRRRRGLRAGAGRVEVAGALIAGEHVRVALLEGAIVALPGNAAVAVIDHRTPRILPPRGGMASRHIQAHRRRERSRRKDQFWDFHHGHLSIASPPARQPTNTGAA